MSNEVDVVGAFLQLLSALPQTDERIHEIRELWHLDDALRVYRDKYGRHPREESIKKTVVRLLRQLASRDLSRMSPNG